MNDAVFNQVMRVRATGAVNMFDVRGVRKVALMKKYEELAEYLESQDNQDDYITMIMTGERPK